MTNSTKKLRRAAKDLRRAFMAGNGDAVRRVYAVMPDATGLAHSGALHVIAHELGFDSWPKLKLNRDMAAMQQADRAERLKMALFKGQHWIVETMLADDPALASANLGLQIALYDWPAVQAALWSDPTAATRMIGVRSPILHLAFSQHLQEAPEKSENMILIAEALVAAGADVNDSFAGDPNSDHRLSALYGALGHAHNMVLARWLLEQGADPNDNESLYHSTELGHHEGLQMLLQHGARPEGTNALLRAMDFGDHTAVSMLLEAGADPNEGVAPHPSGEAPVVVTALHQAARRISDGKMAQILLDAGADPDLTYQGLTAYQLARVYGNGEVAEAISAFGGKTELPDELELLADVADGNVPDGRFVDPAKLPDEIRGMVRTMLHLPETLDHMKRLVAVGIEYDRPDEMGLTPVQLAGWEGLPETLAYLLSLKPDLTHVNKYGGTLLSTIIHGSENSPNRKERAHIDCAELVLKHGVALPRNYPELAGDPDMAAFLSVWADAHPGQVVEP